MEKKARAAKALRSSKSTATQQHKASVGALIVATAFATVAKSLPTMERAEAYLFLAKHLPAAECEQFTMAANALRELAVATLKAEFSEGVALEMLR